MRAIYPVSVSEPIKNPDLSSKAVEKLELA